MALTSVHPTTTLGELLLNTTTSIKSERGCDTINRITSKYHIEIIILAVFFVLGGPVNLHVFQVLRQNTPQSRRLPRSFKMLQKQLNITDLMVLFIYVPSMVCENMESYWKGGDALCKLVHFLQPYSFHMSSNITMLLAIDRLLKASTRALNRVTRTLICLAWLIGALCSAPAFYVWRLDKTQPMKPQCISVFQQVHFNRRQCELGKAQCDNSTYEYFNTIGQLQLILVQVHLFAVFYIPAAVIFCCYAFLVCRVYFARIKKMPPNFSSGAAVPLVPPPRRSFADSVRKSVSTMASKIHRASAEAETVAKDMTIEVVDAAGRTQELRSSVAENEQMLKFNIASQRKAFKRTLLLVVAFILCWIPYIVIIHVKDDGICYLRYAYQFIVINAVINPYLYAVKLKIPNCFRSSTPTTPNT